MKLEILTVFFRIEKKFHKKCLLSNEDFESMKQFVYVFAETHKDRKRSVQTKISKKGMETKSLLRKLIKNFLNFKRNLRKLDLNMSVKRSTNFLDSKYFCLSDTSGD